MAKAKNSGKVWSSEEIQRLKTLAKQNTPTRVMGIKLQRSPEAVQTKASGLKISLNPKNRSPYGRRK